VAIKKLNFHHFQQLGFLYSLAAAACCCQ